MAEMSRGRWRDTSEEDVQSERADTSAERNMSAIDGGGEEVAEEREVREVREAAEDVLLFEMTGELTLTPRTRDVVKHRASTETCRRTICEASSTGGQRSSRTRRHSASSSRVCEAESATDDAVFTTSWLS
jgi:hypothetical protein